jgi:MFS family permease
LVNCLLPLGGAFGAVGAGFILSVIRRKNALMFTDAIGIIGVILGLIVNLLTLCFSRFIIGLAIGLNSALVPLYIKEYSPL